MGQDNFQLIENINLGGDYQKVVLTHSEPIQHILPGSCAVINGRWVAIADFTDSTLSFIVKSSSFLFREEIDNVEFPAGRGFPAATPQSAVVIAGGTGVGAVVLLVNQLFSRGINPMIGVCSRGLDPLALSSFYPQFARAFFVNTKNCSRPKPLLRYLYNGQSNTEVFVAGPKSLVGEVALDAQHLNLRHHTNF